MRLGRAAIALSLVAAGALACSGSVEVRGGDDDAGSTGGLPPGQPTGIELLAGPTLIAPGLGIGRLAVRSDRFEMVGGLSDTNELWAGRVNLAAGSIAVGASAVVQSNYGNTPSLSVRNDTLILCGNPWHADPTQIMEIDESFGVVNHRTIPGNSAGCQGAAFVDGRALLSVHRGPPEGCCSRQVLYNYDDIGTAPIEALPEYELNMMSLVSLDSQFVWAAVVDDETALSVTFSPDGIERQIFRYPLQSQGVGYRRPDVAVNEARGEVMIAVEHTEGLGEVFVVAADGSLTFRRKIGTPANQPRRPSVAVGPSGWYVAWAECTPNSDDGTVIVENVDANGTVDRLEVPTACTSVGDFAVSGDRGVVTWGVEGGTMALGLRL